MTYYEDSFSTTPETTIAAIKSFSEPLVLIVGGSEKGSDFTDLGRVISEAKNIKAVVLVGLMAERIKQAILNAGGKTRLFEEQRIWRKLSPKQRQYRNQEILFYCHQQQQALICLETTRNEETNSRWLSWGWELKNFEYLFGCIFIIGLRRSFNIRKSSGFRIWAIFNCIVVDSNLHKLCYHMRVVDI